MECKVFITEDVKQDLSSDQRQLLAFLEFISTGIVSASLSWKLGQLCHSRWLTFATRILALYAKTLNPSKELKTLVNFICGVYGPCWFEIKRKVHYQHGPSNLFHQMKRICEQPVSVQHIVKKVVQRNAFFALPDNLLAGMLSDNDADIRNMAVLKILKI